MYYYYHYYLHFKDKADGPSADYTCTVNVGWYNGFKQIMENNENNE